MLGVLSDQRLCLILRNRTRGPAVVTLGRLIKDRRRAHRERVFVREEALLLNAPDLTTTGWTGEDEEFVQRVLSELDPLLREAFLLKYVEELSYEEMAALTGAGVSALKMRVKRACDRLRERWERIRDD